MVNFNIFAVTRAIKFYIAMKKNPQYEAIAPAPGSSLFIEELKDFNAANPAYWHYHPEMEIVYVNAEWKKTHWQSRFLLLRWRLIFTCCLILDSPIT